MFLFNINALKLPVSIRVTSGQTCVSALLKGGTQSGKETTSPPEAAGLNRVPLTLL